MFNNLPETVRENIENTIKQTVEVNKQMVDWNLNQSKVAEQQLNTMIANNRSAYEATMNMVLKSQQSMLDQWTKAAAQA